MMQLLAEALFRGALAAMLQLPCRRGCLLLCRFKAKLVEKDPWYRRRLVRYAMMKLAVTPFGGALAALLQQPCRSPGWLFRTLKDRERARHD